VELHYEVDDGASFDYQKGARSRYRLAFWADGRSLRVRVEEKEVGYRPVTVRFVVYTDFRALRLQAGENEHELSLRPMTWRFAGKGDVSGSETRRVTL
jgi:hypothetical protein